MQVDGVDFDEMENYLIEKQPDVGYLNGLAVEHINPESKIQNPIFFKPSIQTKPLMSRISEVSVGYKRTNSDDESDEVEVRVKFYPPEDEETEANCPENTESEISDESIE